MLLPISQFQELLNPLKQHKVHYLRSKGNVGDDLIHLAAYQLMEKADIQLTGPEEAEVLVIAGGGNFGGFFSIEADIRRNFYREYSEIFRKVIVFPQTIRSRLEKNPPKVDKFFVREKISLKKMKGSILAPDLALGYQYQGKVDDPEFESGLFLREDPEGLFSGRYPSLGDPVKLIPSRDVNDYFKLAMKYEKIVTDRLHFAIIGLILSRDTTILPNDYFKNKAMWECWLKDLGCKFSAKPPVSSYPFPRNQFFRMRFQSIKYQVKNRFT
jgi:exopolysaccharide biosynthesis predicted pyruvyltransferase EpsI